MMRVLAARLLTACLADGVHHAVNRMFSAEVRFGGDGCTLGRLLAAPAAEASFADDVHHAACHLSTPKPRLRGTFLAEGWWLTHRGNICGGHCNHEVLRLFSAELRLSGTYQRWLLAVPAVAASLADDIRHATCRVFSSKVCLRGAVLTIG